MGWSFTRTQPAGRAAILRPLAALLAVFAQPAFAATRNFTVTSFDRIRVEAPYQVTLATNRSPFARAEGTATALDAVDLRVEGRTLILRQRRNAGSAGPGGPGRYPACGGPA